MYYKDFKEKKLSALGLGCMRLPTLDGDDGKIDEAAAAEMVAYAMANGINYFDTAYVYHNGQSEVVMGKLLSQYPRESYYLASKFPGFGAKFWGRGREVFEDQLKKCQVSYFDFYLVHNVNEGNIDAYLDTEKYGDIEYLISEKKAGRIGYLGFSAHGSLETMRRFLEKYGTELDFCQIQLNYIDYTFQKAKEKIALLSEFGLPVWVMEPLRGGKLASMSESYASRLREVRPEETIPAWAFRFLQSLPEVKMVLSGMSNMKQLQDNVRTFAEDKPLNEKEMQVLLSVADDILSESNVPCTACRYCTDYCPQGLDIPNLIRIYNEHRFANGGFLAPMEIRNLPEDKRPSACLGCQSCEAVCPQQIKISEIMAKFKPAQA